MPRFLAGLVLVAVFSQMVVALQCQSPSVQLNNLTLSFSVVSTVDIEPSCRTTTAWVAVGLLKEGSLFSCSDTIQQAQSRQQTAPFFAVFTFLAPAASLSLTLTTLPFPNNPTVCVFNAAAKTLASVCYHNATFYTPTTATCVYSNVWSSRGFVATLTSVTSLPGTDNVLNGTYMLPTTRMTGCTGAVTVVLLPMVDIKTCYDMVDTCALHSYTDGGANPICALEETGRYISTALSAQWSFTSTSGAFGVCVIVQNTQGQWGTLAQTCWLDAVFIPSVSTTPIITATTTTTTTTTESDWEAHFTRNMIVIGLTVGLSLTMSILCCYWCCCRGQTCCACSCCCRKRQPAWTPVPTSTSDWSPPTHYARYRYE